MNRYDQLFRLYEEFDTDGLRSRQEFVDLFPPVDSRVALTHWQTINDELTQRKEEITAAFPTVGETFASLAALATRDQAFTALDLYTTYGRRVNVLVLDVDETLRSAGSTDNEIPRETTHMLRRFHEAGVPIVICTGQTLENVKGFLIQSLGNEIIHSGDVSIVYEAGTGVFTPGHGANTKQLLYEDLEPDIRSVFNHLRTEALSGAPEAIQQNCHLQGNEFNVTFKPNYETGSSEARDIIDEALRYLLDLLERCIAEPVDVAVPEGAARQYYADRDPEIRAVLERTGTHPALEGGLPEAVVSLLERIDVAYYEGDAAEVGSLELNKVVGVDTALDVLGIDDPFAFIMGDSKTDLRIMEWAAEENLGIAAAPDHASEDVLAHVMATDDLVFNRGDAASMLETAYALRLLATLE